LILAHATGKGFDLKVLIDFATLQGKMSYHGVSVMKINMKKVLAGLILAGGGFLTTGASAAVIGAWDWVSDGGFIEGASTCNIGDFSEAACSIGYDNAGTTPSGIAGTSSTMTWGTPSGSTASNGEQSGLQGIFGASGSGPYDAQALGSAAVPIPAFEQIITNGGWTNTGAAVHYNNIITTAGGFMNSSVLTTTFELLTPFPLGANTTNLSIQFNETPNSGGCPDGNPHATVCDDVFSVLALLPSFNFFIDGVQYKVSFQFANGPGSIVSGNTIWTAESSPGTAVIFVQARIDTIPLPGVLVLMGLGLMMLGWQVRGKNLA
jgi:hypothetical protein